MFLTTMGNHVYYEVVHDIVHKTLSILNGNRC